MIKTTARKAAAQKAGTTNRKTVRKVGAGKARSKNRKVVSTTVAEKAGATYRKTDAKYEELLVRDTRTPESVRALAKKRVAETREFYVHSLETVLEGWERFVVTAGQSVVAMHRKAIDIARRNADNGFGLAESLAGAKNIAEAMELQTAYWRKQFGAFTAQAAEMRRIPNRMNTEGVTKSKRRLRP